MVYGFKIEYSVHMSNDMLYNRVLDFAIKNIFGKKYVDNNTDPLDTNNVQFCGELEVLE